MFKATTLALLSTASARMSFGSCPDVKYIDNFKPADYAGKWYEIVRDRFNPYTVSADCVTKEFKVNADGDIDLNFRGYYNLAMDYISGGGTMYQCSEGSPTTWTCMATMGSPRRSPYYVYLTDYKNYDIFYMCSNVMGGWMHNEMFSVNSRYPELSEDTLSNINEVVKKNLPQYDMDQSWVLTKPQQKDWCNYEWKFDKKAE